MSLHPTKPSREYPPRHVIIGGFVIDSGACAAWGSRILGKHIPKSDVYAAYSFAHQKLHKEYKTKFTPIGETTGSEWMVVTQSAKFNGWKDMDPALILQFKEAEPEAVSRKLLEEQGVTKYRKMSIRNININSDCRENLERKVHPFRKTILKALQSEQNPRAIGRPSRRW